MSDRRFEEIFEEILDRCIDDIAAGRRTVRECLEAWPEQRDELAPILEAAFALDAMPSAPEQPVGRGQRAAFVAQIRELPQERRRGVLAGFQRLSFPLPTLARAGAVLAPAAALAVVAVFVVLGSGGSVAHASTLTVFRDGVERATDGGWEPLSDGATIEEGDRLRTGAGEALITFGDGSTVALAPDTEVVVVRSRVDGSREIALEQIRGRLWHDVAPDASAAAFYKIETPDASITAQGTLFETVVEDGETSVSTTDGVVTMQAGDRRELVRAGQTARARAHRIAAAAQAAQEHAQPQLRLTVEGPFVASVIAPGGHATGERPDGVVFHQIAGATTSNTAGGAQRVTLTELEEGTYELLIRRVGGGSGTLALAVGENERRIEIPERANLVVFTLRVRFVGGRPVAQLVGQRVLSERDLRAVQERIVLTDRTLERAIPIAERRARLIEEQRERLLEEQRQSDTADDHDEPLPTEPTATPTDALTDEPAPTHEATVEPVDAEPTRDSTPTNETSTDGTSTDTTSEDSSLATPTDGSTDGTSTDGTTEPTSTDGTDSTSPAALQ